MVTRMRYGIVLSFASLPLVMACGDTKPLGSTIEPTSIPYIEATVEMAKLSLVPPKTASRAALVRAVLAPSGASAWVRRFFTTSATLCPQDERVRA